MSVTPTVKVQRGDSYAVINQSDYDPKVDKPYDDQAAAQVKSLADGDPAVKADEAMRAHNANRGVTASPSMDGGRNPDGTFSTPTPTDIRYPDKDETEFANNHGAFAGKSAAQMRKDLELPDMPGGLRPDKQMVKSAKDNADKAFVKAMDSVDVNATPAEKADAAKSGMADAKETAKAMDKGAAKLDTDKAKADADKARAQPAPAAPAAQAK